jgi:hypothetical protein
MMFFLSFVLTFGLLVPSYADSPFLLGDTPLAVKTPYLHAWTAGSLAPVRAWTTLYSLDRVCISKIWATFDQTHSIEYRIWRGLG